MMQSQADRRGGPSPNREPCCAGQRTRGRPASTSAGDAGRVVAAEDPRLVARRRVFLLLEAHRESLGAQLRRRVRMRRRYEDLWLVKMVIRLQREYLSQSAPGDEGLSGWRWRRARDRRLGEALGPDLPASVPGGSQRLRPEAEELGPVAVRGHPENGEGTGGGALRLAHGRDGGRAEGGRVHVAALGLRPASVRTSSALVDGAARRSPRHAASRCGPAGGLRPRRAEAGCASAPRRRCGRRRPAEPQPGELRRAALAEALDHAKSPRAGVPQADWWLRVGRAARRDPRLPRGRPGTAQAPGHRQLAPQIAHKARAWPA